MKIHLPSGLAVEVTEPATDFPKLIDEAEKRIDLARKDAAELKRLAKHVKAWPVEQEAK